MSYIEGDNSETYVLASFACSHVAVMTCVIVMELAVNSPSPLPFLRTLHLPDHVPKIYDAVGGFGRCIEVACAHLLASRFHVGGRDRSTGAMLNPCSVFDMAGRLFYLVTPLARHHNRPSIYRCPL